jgi:hypothetical protein
MELVEIIALTHFEDSRIGSVSNKMRLKVPSVVADDLQSIGVIEIVNPPVATARSVHTTAPQVDGRGVSPVLLQADRVSPRKIATSLETKDGRPLLSMTATAEHHSRTAYTLAMINGGEFTLSESNQNTKANVGLKTRGRPRGTKSTALGLSTKKDSALMA